eukprot:9262-Heterococcus_DN1.PRE.1
MEKQPNLRESAYKLLVTLCINCPLNRAVLIGLMLAQHRDMSPCIGTNIYPQTVSSQSQQHIHTLIKVQQHRITLSLLLYCCAQTGSCSMVVTLFCFVLCTMLTLLCTRSHKHKLTRMHALISERLYRVHMRFVPNTARAHRNKTHCGIVSGHSKNGGMHLQRSVAHYYINM